MPSGPSVLVLPGTGKSFDQFRGDDYMCRQFAFGQVGGVTPNQVAVASGVGSAAIGTAVGAAAGAAIGGGEGAAVGAGGGLLAGSAVGAGAASSSGYVAQERYDMSYIQCMYSKGHRVPVSGRFIDESPAVGNSPPASVPPPPPPDAPPPPTR
jgi:hypothetical protein